jgi:hypothetical protein
MKHIGNIDAWKRPRSFSAAISLLNPLAKRINRREESG